jgi:hypothetical protein
VGSNPTPSAKYTVLPCSPTLGIHSNFNALPRNPVVLCSPMFCLIAPLTVVFDRGFGGRFSRRTKWLDSSNHSTSRHKPLPGIILMGRSLSDCLWPDSEKPVLSIMDWRQGMLARFGLAERRLAQRGPPQTRCSAAKGEGRPDRASRGQCGQTGRRVLRHDSGAWRTTPSSHHCNDRGPGLS